MEKKDTRAGQVQYQAICHGEQTDREGWRHDLWDIEINGVTVEYRTGIGLRETVRHAHPRPVPPPPDSVLHSLIMDWQCSRDSFEDFCANFGYDEDSRRALDTYLACQESGKKLLKMRLGKSIQELVMIYQDF